MTVEGGRMKSGILGEERDLTVSDLRWLTNELIAEVRRRLRRCVDADVVFVPVDPFAHDPDAEASGKTTMAWTLGHVIAHMTASAEEAATVAAELARGVPYHGRSRYEVPWQEMTTVAQCYTRLEESRRMRLASLDMWPGAPHLENVYMPWEGAPAMGPMQRFMIGLRHDADHLAQVREVVRQARAHRLRKMPLGRWRLWVTAHAGIGNTLRSASDGYSRNAGLL